MNNKKIIIVTMSLVLIIFSVLIILTAIKNDDKEQHNENVANTGEPTNTSSDVTTTQLITPSPTAEIMPLIAFDASFENSINFNSQMVFVEKRVFYVINNVLYGYDLEENKKVFEEEIYAGSFAYIFESRGYVYYEKDWDVWRVNATTLETEMILNATEVFQTIRYENVPNEYGKESAFWFIINDDVIIASFHGYEGEADFISEIYAMAYVDEWEYKRIIFKEGDYGYKPFIHGDTIIFRNLDYLDLTDLKLSENEQDGKVEYLVEKSDQSYLVEDIASYAYRNITMSGDYLFMTSWPNCSSNTYVLNKKTNQLEKELVNGSVVSVAGLNQYVILYYFDMIDQDWADTKNGVRIFDTKREIEYNDEEINSIISGDISSYFDLMYMEYYQKDNKIYAMKRELDISNSDEYEKAEGEIIFRQSTQLIVDRDSGEKVYFVNPNFNIGTSINLYEVEIVEGKLHFTLLYKEFEP